MGRPLRLKATNLTYHITSRTDGHRILLQTKRDRRQLCRILQRTLSKYSVLLYAFTCMGNHFHALIRIENESDLSQVMCEFKTSYAKYFNRRYQRSGHFWGDRFRSTIIQDDKHALTCMRYIDRNPVKAGLIDHPGNWPYGSFNVYTQGQSHPLLKLVPHPSYLSLSPEKERRKLIYLSFVLGSDPESDGLHGHLPRFRIYGSNQFIQDVEQQIK